MNPTERVAKARKAAKERLGAAWNLLGPDVREAFVCRELVAMLGGLECESNPRLASWSETATLTLQENT